MNPRDLINEHFADEREDFDPYIVTNSIVDGLGTIHLEVDGHWIQIECGDVEYANIIRDELIALLKASRKAIVIGNRRAKDAGLQARGF